MEQDCKVTVMAFADAESNKKPGAKCGSRLTTALLGLTLFLACAAAVVFFSSLYSKNPGQDEVGFDIHHTLRHISNVRAAIHLTGQYNSQIANSVEWINQVDPSHSQGGLELKDNEIVIPQSGLYFVYSQVSFRVSCRKDDNDDASATSLIHLTHRVRRWSNSFGNDEYRTILHSVRTACQKTDTEEEGNWYSAVYMGAVFNLNKGDKLKTVTEKMLPNLEEETGKTFFGVFAL
ncbi:tumor necrosis factor a (TNF superfamily, member 2) [Corythoichthys intestinalis]|uniref:tumor necrosis factor a (TNF superfamily, member 2) n=1 Tax=Corythoichthys intestinalis TaxID=161448 RepID=UPI0025A50228|nr:tumor necrosis factor a (TNF superfamily, member 2) [Corythoichthys intestinalis]XP_061808530.1 tumor necrosis factor-like [Nerophis lumbriciformis]